MPSTPPAHNEAAVLTEPAKIQALLKVLEESQATFIRSGSEYDGKRAADHLWTKLKSADGRELSARQFIEHVASKSSLSGREYQVRENGETVASRVWFTKKLDEIERAAK